MRGLPIIVVAVLVVPVHAQESPADPPIDKSAAEKLFEEGRAELQAGRPDAACKKFEQSIRKDPRAVGTLLNLGLCTERQGKIASALALFIEAYDRATEAGQAEQRTAAEEHIKTLRPQVPILAITYAEHLPGEKLVVDDRVIGADEKELPLDPGPHTIVLTAPGRLPYETTVVAKSASRIPLALPALAVPQSGRSGRALAGRITTIGGAALVVGAGVLVVYGRHSYHEQFEGTPPHCGAAPPIDGKPVCDDIGEAAVERAQRYVNVGGVVGVVGIVAVATGVTLWLTAPNETRVVPTASASGAGVTIVGRF